MADLLGITVTTIATAVTGRAKTAVEWVFRNATSALLLTLLAGVVLEVVAKGSDGFTLDPAVAAARVLDVLGVHDVTPVDQAIAWLGRPELGPVAVAASVLAGVLVFLPARYAAEAAWWLLVPAAVTIGADALWAAVWAFVVVTAGSALVAWRGRRAEGRWDGRERFGPSQALVLALRGVVTWALTPFGLVLRLFGMLDAAMTYESRRRPATGARVVRPGQSDDPAPTA